VRPPFFQQDGKPCNIKNGWKDNQVLQHPSALHPAQRWYTDTPSLQKTGNYLIQYWLTVILLVRKFPALCLELNHRFLSVTQETDKYIVGAECRVSDAKCGWYTNYPDHFTHCD